jgi:hypothetical protein
VWNGERLFQAARFGTEMQYTTWNVKLFFRLSWTEVLQGHKDL